MRGRYPFKVRSYECGPDGRATIATICNYLQESASVNAEELGFSKSNFESAGENISWVLTRLVVKMTRYPRWEEEVFVETFPRGGRKIVAWRDFEVKSSDGEVLGYASSEWMLIDLASRKVVAIPEHVFTLVDPTDRPVLGENPFSKYRSPSDREITAAGPFRALRSHIDLNGHVNNVHYLEWMLEAGTDAYPTDLEVTFRSETLAGDEVLVESALGEDGARCYRVFAPDGRDHIIALTR